MPKIIVFLGPSLSRDVAEKILPAEYRPPAKRGDLITAAREGTAIIGLIDGVFHQESAVAHREILAALKGGIRVIGSSSMGALRAAEMDTIGMMGVGEIYKMYKSGKLIADDEVALVFDPVSGMSLSEPLINIRFTLKRALNDGIINATAHDTLLASARSLFYPKRTYKAIVTDAKQTIDAATSERFLAWVETHNCDQKRTDAIAALEFIRTAAEQLSEE